MTFKDVSDALATAASRMVEQHDATGALDRLLGDALKALGVDAAAVLVVSPSGELEVLAATSHRIADLELYQTQAEEGPCIEGLRTARPVSAVGEDIVRRWPQSGPVIVRAGYTWVHASPLVWQGRTFGALNVFRRQAATRDEEPDESVMRAFAHAATMLIVTSGGIRPEVLEGGLQAALAGRAAVEQAKGALAQVRGLDMEQAFDALRAIVRAEGIGLGEAASQVLERARSFTLR